MWNSRKIIIQVALNIMIVVPIVFLCLVGYGRYKSDNIDAPISVFNEKVVEPTEKVEETVVIPVKEKEDEVRRVSFDSELLNCGKDVYYGIYYFKSDKYYSNGNSEKTPSASVLKVFIMQYIYIKGFDLDETINGQSVRDLIEDMIQNSDNDATNILIDRFGMKKINKFIKKFGYKDTVLARKMISYSEVDLGVRNFTSLDDVILFLKTLYENRNKKPYSTMLEIMKDQNTRDKIPLFLPKKVVVANKTGEQNVVENDIGIVFTKKGDFAIAVLINKVEDTDATRIEIANFAKKAYSRALKQ